MKKVIILSYILSFSLVALWARTPEQAAQIAGHFIAQRGSAQPIHQRIQRAVALEADTQAVELAYTFQYEDQSPALYVFNGPTNGFVLVSAHEQARTILGCCCAPIPRQTPATRSISNRTRTAWISSSSRA
jgi:hypothetical protein